jgi:hypothetical protein
MRRGLTPERQREIAIRREKEGREKQEQDEKGTAAGYRLLVAACAVAVIVLGVVAGDGVHTGGSSHGKPIRRVDDSVSLDPDEALFDKLIGGAEPVKTTPAKDKASNIYKGDFDLSLIEGVEPGKTKDIDGRGSVWQRILFSVSPSELLFLLAPVALLIIAGTLIKKSGREPKAASAAPPPVRHNVTRYAVNASASAANTSWKPVKRETKKKEREPMDKHVKIAIIISAALISAAWIVKPKRYEAVACGEKICVIDKANGDLWLRRYRAADGMVRIRRKEQE